MCIRDSSCTGNDIVERFADRRVIVNNIRPVSYTHLDVYKRQGLKDLSLCFKIKVINHRKHTWVPNWLCAACLILQVLHGCKKCLLPVFHAVILCVATHLIWTLRTLMKRNDFETRIRAMFGPSYCFHCTLLTFLSLHKFGRIFIGPFYTFY